VGINLLDKAVG